MVKTVFAWILLSILAIGALIGVMGAIFGLQVATAGLVGRGEAHIRIQSADTRLAAYDHFFNLCVAVQSSESGLDAQYDMLTAKPGDPVVLTNIAGLKSKRSQDIYQYNADSAKGYTIAQFKANNLPYRLSDASYDKKGPHTQCAA